MINIITEKDLIKEYHIFNNANLFVRGMVSAQEFGDLDEYAIKYIDKANLLDRKTGAVETPFGLTDIYHLSTGCKTVLMYLYIYRHRQDYDKNIVINITECGWNAIDVLFDCVEKLCDSHTLFFLGHEDGIFNCKKRDYFINKEVSITDLSFI